MKKIFLSLFLFFTFFNSAIFAQEDYRILFLKGNIIDKINAVRKASDEGAVWVTNKAIDFVLENKKILNDDREIDSLAVAAILATSNDYINSLSTFEKNELLNRYIQMFNTFENSSNVQIAIISKVTPMKDTVDLKPFVSLLNNFIAKKNPAVTDVSVYKSVINSLAVLGNNTSFTSLYNSLNDNSYAVLYPEIERTVVQLIPVSMDEVLQITHSKNINQISKILDLIKKNNDISSKFLSEIAENILNESILLLDNSSGDSKALVGIQMEALQILNDNKWTRASESVISFYEVAKFEYSSGVMTEDQYITVIKTLPNIAPITSVNNLIRTLGELNISIEIQQDVSEAVVLAVINSLGTIGDKSAFDALLSVTYLNYPETVLSAARVALAGLKW